MENYYFTTHTSSIPENAHLGELILFGGCAISFAFGAVGLEASLSGDAICSRAGSELMAISCVGFMLSFIGAWCAYELSSE